MWGWGGWVGGGGSAVTIRSVQSSSVPPHISFQMDVSGMITVLAFRIYEKNEPKFPKHMCEKRIASITLV